jgi:hypothetical protein
MKTGNTIELGQNTTTMAEVELDGTIKIRHDTVRKDFKWYVGFKNMA